MKIKYVIIILFFLTSSSLHSGNTASKPNQTEEIKQELKAYLEKLPVQNMTTREQLTSYVYARVTTDINDTEKFPRFNAYRNSDEYRANEVLNTTLARYMESAVVEFIDQKKLKSMHHQ